MNYKDESHFPRVNGLYAKTKQRYIDKYQVISARYINIKDYKQWSRYLIFCDDDVDAVDVDDDDVIVAVDKDDDDDDDDDDDIYVIFYQYVGRITRMDQMFT